jgi:ribonuclease HI
MKSRSSSWLVHIDGASLGNPGQSGAGMVAVDEQGCELWRDSVHLGQMTNNMAEYEALIHTLQKAIASSVDSVTIYTDSLLVANQIKGIYKVKNSNMQIYVHKALDLVKNLTHFEIHHIDREQNRVADRLAKQAAEKTG